MKVTFRKITWLNPDNITFEEVNAIFPEEVEAVVNGEKQFLCYAHIGQHSTIHEDFLNGVVNNEGIIKVELTTEEEYKPLLDELVSIGYEDLEVVS